MALSVSGLLMQTIFRNPLAGPYLLGVSSGASLGVALFMMGTAGGAALEILYSVGVAASAWIGSVLVLLVVMAVSARLKDIMAILILGMMLGSATSAFVSLLQFTSSESALKGYVLWGMGSVGGLSYGEVGILACSTLLGLMLALSMTRNLNLLLLGENYARVMGVPILRSRMIIFISTALLAGGVTAFCGPIAFVGTAAPHLARMIFRRADHGVLLPASLVMGVVMMLCCDLLSTLPWGDMVLPLNTTTSLMGIPIVIMVVVGSRKKRMF